MKLKFTKKAGLLLSIDLLKRAQILLFMAILFTSATTLAQLQTHSDFSTFPRQAIPLYVEIPGSRLAPGYKEKIYTSRNGVTKIKRVSIPQIAIFLPEKSLDGAAVIICPGGGYGLLAYNLEGTDIARTLNEWGIAAIVLKYRLPSDSIMKDKSIGPLQDAQRAIQFVRENATQLKINPEKIGIMGFSAGGHLAATLSTHFEKTYIDNPLNTSLRPDFSILVYPVISLSDKLAHVGSRNNLLGKNPPPELIKEFSNELHVTAQTPPTFLMLARDDKVVNPENSIRYYEELLKANVPAEIHIYKNGGHGFGAYNRVAKENWMGTLKHWMQRNNFIHEKAGENLVLRN